MLFTCQPEEASLMSETPASDVPPEGSHQARNAVIAIIVVILLLTAGLVAIAAVLAVHAETAGPSVRVIRDLLIIVMALEMVVIGAAFVVLLVQVARFINLINNELQPLITATSDTVNTVRGTAVFLSKNLAEPIIAANSALRGVAKVVGDADAIRRAAGIAAAAVAATTSATTTHIPSPASVGAEEAGQTEAGEIQQNEAKGKTSPQSTGQEKIEREEHNDK